MNQLNPPLTWYGPTTLDDLPGRLCLNPVHEQHAADLTFRDSDGRWWRPCRDGSWLRHDSTGWTSAARPERLEGSAPLPTGVASLTPIVGDEPLDDEPLSLGIQDGLARSVDLTLQSYRAGRLTSTMAELMLSRWMLLTSDGRVWTVGAQSRAWYAHNRNGWEVQTSQPKGPFITGAEADAIVEATNSPVRRWAEEGPFIPEAVTPSWLVPLPPASAPVAENSTATDHTNGEWVYVVGQVEVQGLYDSAVVVGSMHPGTWYLMKGEERGWARVADPDGRFEGWAPAASVRRQSDPVDPEPAPAPTEAVAVWTASHTVPTEGLQAWATPDPAGQVIANLAGGVELQIVERRADWAHVLAENGWEAWVDGRRLVLRNAPPQRR